MIFLLLLAALCSSPCAVATSWPAGKKAAVVLTYDDGLSSQLDNAIPALDRHGFKATFFLDGRVQPADFTRWAAVARAGHELGNHSVFHPGHSSYAFIKATGYAIDEYTPKRMAEEIRIMNKLLFAIDGREVKRSYAYPCYNRALINGNFGMTPLADGSSTIDAVRASGVVSYARGGDINPVITDFKKLDLFYVPAAMFPGGSVDTLIALIDEAMEKGGLLVIALHGIGAESLMTPLAEHERLLLHLAANPVWVAPFGEVMRNGPGSALR
jgi:peptidoglycan/xylan/chitin deacetylase (PgdA/CDA1 family)